MESNYAVDTCRVCLVRGKPMTSIFNFHDTLQYSHKIMHCAKIKISEFDELPSVICKQCQSDLSIAYDFVVKCQNSDDDLRKSYQLKYVKLHQVEEVPIKYENDSDEAEFEDDRLGDIVDNSLIMVKEEALQVEFVNEKTKNDNTEPPTKKPERRITFKEGKMTKIVENKTQINDKSIEQRLLSSKSNVTCEICGLVTKSKAVMICHMRKHTGEKPFICPTCGTGFARKGALQMHIKRRHSEDKNVKQFACEKCGKLFICRTEMKIHLRTHTGETPYACEYCQKRFTQLSNLIGHRRRHTGERPYSCSICQKTFNDKSVLNRHALVHTKNNPFTCNVCGKSVKTHSSLLGHIAVQHTGVNPVVCDQCGTVCKTKGNLNSHIKNVHSSKAGTCTVCSKTFGDLASHMRRHTGEDILSCKTCDKKFSHKQSLTIHMKTHADKFKCDE